jgi:DME family drug/metabolite transporter
MPLSPIVSARSGALSVLTAAVLWGTTGTASTFAPAGARPAAIGSAGLAIGGSLLFLTRRRGSPPAAFSRPQRCLLALGAVAVAGYPLTFYPAVARCGVAVATVIALGSAPAFAGLLAWLTGQGRPARPWAAATLAAVAGCAVLITGPLITGHAHASHAGASHGTAVPVLAMGPVSVMGIVLAAVAGLSYAVYAQIGGRLIGGGHSARHVVGSMFGGGALLALPVLAADGTRWLGTVRGAGVALHLAIFTTFLAYRLFGRGLRGISAQWATTLTLAESVVAAALGVVVLGERLPAVSWAGMAILAVGLAGAGGRRSADGSAVIRRRVAQARRRTRAVRDLPAREVDADPARHRLPALHPRRMGRQADPLSAASGAPVRGI